MLVQRWTGLLQANTHLRSDPRAAKSTRRRKINNGWILSAAFAVAHIGNVGQLDRWGGREGIPLETFLL